MNSKTKGEYRFAIEYYIFREGDNLIAYCPSLDISTSGKDYSDAVKNFYERFQIYPLRQICNLTQTIIRIFNP